MDIRVYDHYPPGTATGQCYRCRTHQRDLDSGCRERVVDLGVDIDFEGRIAICETCAIEVGHNLGLLTPAEADALREQVAELTARAEAAESRAAEADALFASLARYDEARAATTSGAEPGAAQDGNEPAPPPAEPAKPAAPAKKAAPRKAAAPKKAAAKK